MDLTQIIVSLVLFVAVFLLVWSLFGFPVEVEAAEHRRIAMAVGSGTRDTIFEWAPGQPVMSLALTAARRMGFAPLRRFVVRWLDASGNPSSYSVDEYLAIALICGCGLGLGSGVLGVALLGQFDLAIVAAMGVLGAGVPLWVLYDTGRGRVHRISKQLPYTLDLIALAMTAGSTFSEAIDAIVRDNPDDDFNQELRTVQAEIEFGASRSAALAGLARRIPLGTLRSVIGAVNQAEALGTPLAIILKTQSSVLRMHRSVRAEKLSASASLRILIPSMLILIAVVLVVFGPLIVSWAGNQFTF
ncbi:MAG: type II secretion system F family protein [Planctomycetota bacterium]|nr:type II secretion system F family protein [Planctomycetota bacterium]